MNGELPAGAREAAVPASPLTAQQLAARVFPRRWRWFWGAAFRASWLLAACVVFVFKCWPDICRTDPPSTWPSVSGTFFKSGVFASILLLTGAAVLVPVIGGINRLFEDLHAGGLPSLLLTNLDRRAILRAYFRRIFVTATLVIVTLAPAALVFNRGPAPLYLDWPGPLYPFWWEGPARFALTPNVQSFVLGAAGVFCDLATAYLAAGLALGAAVLLRSRPWAITWSFAGLAAFMALSWRAGRGLEHVFHDLKIPKGISLVEQEWWGWDQSTFFYWAFAILYAAAAWALSEICLRHAARRLDRLVTD